MEYIKCNLCGSWDYEVIHKGLKEEKVDLTKKYASSSNVIGNEQIVQCKKCGLKFVNPRLTDDEIVKGYSEGSDEMFVSQAKGRELTFKKSLKLINKNATKGKILDIGTAGGSFLKVAKENGWQVEGIEPNKWLCEWGLKNYGIPIKPGTIFDKKNRFNDNEFEAVTLWDVLEHVTDPKKTLTEISRILKPRGLLVVNYPDIGSSVSRLMGKRWIFLLSVHLFYFDKKSIVKMLNASGFEVIKIKKHFQKLSLGYLIYRMDAYNHFLYKVGDKVAGILHLKNIQFPYWLGQTLVLARKK
ncbi:MAG: class I SAM-dependent methyltransferase [Candidatus Nanoarchaeia archaeon]|nr:class I SAM-dependent methyltransferase [Candidatus Nanoarchaeia archaeon]MDD5587609.1 class I SAM-dependent methyltransferase [Candidatus Nanoarchaeia archaeon]